jgi:hypothetical protein
MPHLEIAAIFLGHSCNYFLKPQGKLAFVFPRAFLTADQHDNTRSGGTKRVRLTAVWDLLNVNPLFMVPSCVLFADVGHENLRSLRAIPSTGIPGLSFSGKLQNTNTHWEDAKHSLTQTEDTWFYSKLSQKKNARSALTTQKISGKRGDSYYASGFKQGATIVPRTFYFVTPEQSLQKNLKDSVIQCETIALPEAKVPWKDLTLKGRINTKYLFRTALSKNIVPFALVSPLFVLLPIALTKIMDRKRISLLNSENIFKKGDRETAEWFKQAEELWNKNRTENAVDAKMDLYKRLDYQRGLSEQNLNARYLVLYTASAKDANAVVIDREEIELNFIVDHIAYWCATSTKTEANYLACFLNSNYANETIKDFQSRGLFGPRHVHKSILGLPFPQYDTKNPLHTELAKLGEQCAKSVSKIVEDEVDLEGHRLGSVRVNIRKALAEELKEIDVIVKKVMGR